MTFLPREGFTVDFVAKLAQTTVLNPIITIPLAVSSFGLLMSSSTGSDWSQSLEAARSYTYSLAVLSALLYATDFLNRQFNNNWTTDPAWDWDNEIVVITGGSSGIGAHLAQKLHARNPKTKVVIIDYYYQCDLSDSSQIRAICEKIRTEVGHPTVLVNNAGICRGVTVCDGSYADVEVTIRTNLIAPFLLVKEFNPDMARRNHGHIVNISSMSAYLPPVKVADYAATKAGLIALHEVSLRILTYSTMSLQVSQYQALQLDFTRTPLFKGKTNQSNFLFPLLDVESVSEAIAKTLWSGYGKTMFMPGIMRYIAILVSCLF
ncbi:hypothetical protein LCI18_008407 [Fusarium solani-melongenae]|uniref:Uncharacterized protein n=1 Tax=Fusarium solani subsp. cucurbitae TaxID=2747967 RepID=A0ACD3Z8D7_FUSSC|nr:hypothetical protein LCI18_008407 [Fusarium solani-melongenae]